MVGARAIPRGARVASGPAIRHMARVCFRSFAAHELAAIDVGALPHWSSPAALLEWLARGGDGECLARELALDALPEPAADPPPGAEGAPLVVLDRKRRLQDRAFDEFASAIKDVIWRAGKRLRANHAYQNTATTKRRRSRAGECGARWTMPRRRSSGPWPAWSCRRCEACLAGLRLGRLRQQSWTSCLLLFWLPLRK